MPGSGASTAPPSAPSMRAQRTPISLARLEVVISRAVAAFGLLYGAQTLPIVLAQQPHMVPAWWLGGAVAIYGLLILSVFASIVKRWVRLVNGAHAVALLVVLVTWGLAVSGDAWPVAERAWPWFLLTVATAAAAVAFPVWLATVYTIVVPLIYGVYRVTELGGSAPLLLVGFDIVYAVILGGVVVVIVTMLRSAAASVDAAQATALARYTNAVREHAIEVERVQVDSIVHDSVLTALLSAGRAQTAEQKANAATLARNAIAHLRAAEAAVPDDDTTVSIRALAQRITEAQAQLPGPFRMRAHQLPATTVPVSAADAVLAATVQAMVNSVQHAGDGGSVRRWVTVTGDDSGRIGVEVGDDGLGFDTDAVPDGRLGVRVSIVERMLGAGGTVDIESAPGRGTLVRIEWPAPEPPVSDEPSDPLDSGGDEA